MPFIRNEEYEGLLRDRQDLVEQNERVGNLRAELDETRAALDGLRDTVQVDTTVKERLAAYRSTVHIQDVEQSVVDDLTREGEEKIRADLAEGIKAKRRNEVTERIRTKKGPTILADLTRLYETDDTFKTVDEEAEEAVRTQLAADLKAQRRAKTEEELGSPEAKAALTAELEAELADDPEIADHRAKFEAHMRKKWQREAEQKARADAENAVLALKEQIIADLARKYGETYDGERDLERVRRKAREEVEALAIKDLLAGTENAEYTSALAERQALEARKLAAKNQAEKLALDFTNGGIDTSAIEKDTQLTIQLGDVKVEDVRVKDRYGDYVRTESGSVLTVRREIRLTSLGGGLYRVDSDTLAASNNTYAALAGLREGAKITIGILISQASDDGESHRELLPRLKAGAALQYDTDTSTPEFTDSHLSVANVRIGEQNAREFKATKQELL